MHASDSLTVASPLTWGIDELGDKPRPRRDDSVEGPESLESIFARRGFVLFAEGVEAAWSARMLARAGSR